VRYESARFRCHPQWPLPETVAGIVVAVLAEVRGGSGWEPARPANNQHRSINYYMSVKLMKSLHTLPNRRPSGARSVHGKGAHRWIIGLTVCSGEYR